jgi:predicted dehydrogenase
MTNPNPFRVAVIGTGMIANAGHFPAWQSLGRDVEVVGAADIDVSRARQSAEHHGIPHAYGDWQQMLDELQPDIVSVCTPNMYHKEQAIAALRAGAHVFCEKPAATSYADVEAMYAAADGAGRTLFITQTARFNNTARTAKDYIDAGYLGEVYYAETSMMRRRGIPKWGVFHIKEHSGGGPIYDIGVHSLDLLFWLMGTPKVTAVSGQTYLKLGNRDEGLVESLTDSGAPSGVISPRPYDHREFDVEDFASGYIRLEGGATVGFRTSWAANIPEGVGNTFLVGTEAGLQLRPLTLIRNMGGYQVDITPKVLRDRDVGFSGHWGAARHFVNVLRGEEEILVKREQVLNVMRVLDSLYQSAAEGREIRL